MAIVCPITNAIKGFPLHVPLDERTKTTGVIMCEQAKSRKIVVDMCGLFIYNEDYKLPIIQIIRKLPKLLSYTTIMLL